MNVGSLFSGIGGFDLGLERAGFTTSWFCEQDEFCQHVLAKHWPGVPCYPDITRLRGADVEPVDVLCGGFPCQDLSVAGKGAGLAGARSGLWSEYARLIGELGPRYVIVENVSALLARGMGTVLGDLAALGYDAEWDCLPASAFGAPHRRDRVWLVAYPGGEPGGLAERGSCGPRREPADPREPTLVRQEDRAGGAKGSSACDRARHVDDSNGVAWPPRGAREGQRGTIHEPGAIERAFGSGSAPWEQWLVEPDVGRVADGVPARVDRLRSLGNALVPQIAEWIGERVMAYEATREVAA